MQAAHGTKTVLDFSPLTPLQVCAALSKILAVDGVMQKLVMVGGYHQTWADHTRKKLCRAGSSAMAKS